MPEVYITRAAKFLPNLPISNEEMDGYLGLIDGKPSKGKALTLRSNGIKSRYYAIDKQGNSTHSNAEMTALAIMKLTDHDFTQNDIELLACGTTSPDNMLPSHAAMVHGELSSHAIEIVSTAGSCCTGIQAMKFAFMSIKSGNSKNAVCTGSEKLSSWMRSEHFEKETENLAQMEKFPIISFEKEFLRWMLSDGAGAFLLESQPRGTTSLKIEWIDICSFANELETCMYAGGDKNVDGSVSGWKDFLPEEWLAKSIFALKQDVKLLGKNIVQKGIKYLVDTAAKRNFDLNSLDYFLPHISSEYFRAKIGEELLKYEVNIPQEKWMINLSEIGNIGSGSIYIMLEELINSGRLKKGQKIILLVPESARFSYAVSLLTVC